ASLGRADRNTFPLCLGGNVFGSSADEPQSWDGFWWGALAAVLELLGAAGAVIAGRRAANPHAGGTTPVAGIG
ncbi:MAG: hypothetical protein QOJ57_1502, partial [Thermoleophilaceae bacterium]|nr:hypothetical protein [Thermoleophilaceae bacterium]